MSQCCTLKQHLGLLDMLLVPCFKSVQPALPEVVIRDMLLPRYKPNHIDSLAKEASVEDLLYLRAAARDLYHWIFQSRRSLASEGRLWPAAALGSQR